ncbi:MAG: apolipoprotein N-acyltransferase [Desulfobulbaceae bacterium]|nr:apolipoprotein N-acyltransferase [Desulfobulbaceae bacterium]
MRLNGINHLNRAESVDRLLFGAPFLSGLLLFFSSPGPTGNGILAWIALIPLLWALNRVGPKRAARLGLVMGLIYYTLLLSWILIVLGTYGHLPLWVSIPALLMLSLYMSLYTALFSAGLSWCAGTIPAVWAAPVLWVALDLIRSRLFSGFPWQDLAYSQYRFPILIQSADLLGHYGITFMIVLVNGIILATLSYLFQKKRVANRLVLTDHGTINTVEKPSDCKGSQAPQLGVIGPCDHTPCILQGPSACRWGACDRLRLVLPAVLLAGAILCYSFLRYNQIAEVADSADTITVAVIQGNIDQDRKWVPSLQKDAITSYLKLSESAISEQKIDMVVWPETAMPFFPMENRLFPGLVDRLVKKNRIFFLAGAPHREFSPDHASTRYFNSAFLVSAAGDITGRYDKQHLVPFGEYIPLKKILPLPGPLVETIGDFTPGTFREPISCQNAKIGVLICFESIFPELARVQAAGGANLLVNLTNDAWFGRSGAPWQHLSMAVLRAVETRTSLVRAANTGISGFVDPLGRLSRISPLFVPYSLIKQVALLDKETFFVAFGHWFASLCLILLFPGFILVRQRRKMVPLVNRYVR